jgi:hypothetical protein
VQRNETCKNEKEFQAGRKTNFPTTPFPRPTNVVVFGRGKKKKVDLFLPRHAGIGGVEVQLHSFLTLALD